MEMTASVKHEVPISKNILAATFNNRVIGVAFKKEQAVVKDYLKKLGEEDPEACQKLIDSMTANGSAEVGPLDNGKTYTVTPDMVSYKPTVMKIHEEKFIPSVVEPSFGVGRIMYAILEHSFYVREGEEKRTVMAFKPAVAAVKAAIMPINNSEQFNGLVEELGDKLRYYALAFRTDASSASIGRRYARADEVGIPFAVTVDFETLNKDSELFRTVTLRERDSMKQIRLPVEDVASVLNEVVKERTNWDALLAKYPQVTVAEEQTCCPVCSEFKRIPYSAVAVTSFLNDAVVSWVRPLLVNGLW